jgi:DNA-directed RNA polymerase subunit RPC12/RpoP
MKSTQCPHCGKTASHLGLLVYTKWTGYRCSACKKKSRFDARATARAGGLGVFVGALSQALFDFHGVSRVIAVVAMTAVFVVVMSRFMVLKPVEG